MDLILSLLQLLLSHFVVFLSLGEVEFKLGSFTLTLDRHVLLPVLDALSEPLLHEASVALELIDLDSAHLLLGLSVSHNVGAVSLGRHGSLAVELVVVLLLVGLEIDIFLSAIELAKALFEEVVGDIVVLGLGHSDALGGLVVAEGAGLSDD